MAGKDLHPCLVSLLILLVSPVVLLFILFGLLVIASLFGPHMMPRGNRVEVVHGATHLPASVDISRIDALIDEHSRWEKSGEKSPHTGEELFDLVLRKDINGDPQADEVRSDGCSFEVYISRHEGYVVRDPSVYASGATSVGLDDVDGDGLTDAWCCDPADDVVRVLYGDAEQTFIEVQFIHGVGECEGAFHDVDGDGNLDIVFREFEYGPKGETTPTGEYRWIELEPIR